MGNDVYCVIEPEPTQNIAASSSTAASIERTASDTTDNSLAASADASLNINETTQNIAASLGTATPVERMASDASLNVNETEKGKH